MRNRILVVDDSPYVADASARLISVCGYDVRTAYSGPDAIEQMETFSPHMVLMDIGMPDMDGYETAALIRRNAAHDDVLLVAVTCYAGEEDKKRALAAGFDLHVAKPVRLTTLYGLLTTLQRNALTTPMVQVRAASS